MDYSLNISSHHLKSPRRARLPETPNCAGEGSSCVSREKLIAKRRFPDVSTPKFIPEKSDSLSVTEVKRLNDSVIESAVIENDAITSAAIVNVAIENDAIENDAIENDAIENDATASSVTENDATASAILKNDTCECHPRERRHCALTSKTTPPTASS